MSRLKPVIEALVSHALASARFDRVGRHEPKDPPGTGVSASVIAGPLAPARGRSGLSATSIRWEVTARLLVQADRPDGDDIDVDLMDAVDAWLEAISADYTLGGLAAEVDLLGAYGAPMGVTPGYVKLGEQVYRSCDVVLPVIFNDLYVQEP